MASLLGHFAPFTVDHSPDSNGVSKGAEKPLVKGLLEVEVHQAKDLHNICIYAKQDVYAKLTLSEDGAPQATFRTEVVDKGGKDPVFNQKFCTAAPVQSDSVLRCEVWMASKLRDYLQDQLLGVVSVPISSVVGMGKQFSEYGLSSTELFHSPSGSLSMTLEFVEDEGSQSASNPFLLRRSQSSQSNNNYESQACNSTTSTTISGSSEGDPLCGIDSKVVEFRDLADAREDEEMVSDFIRRASKKQNVEAAAKDDGILTGPPYLKLDCSTTVVDNNTGQRNGSPDEQTDEHSVVEEVTEKISSFKQVEAAAESKCGVKQQAEAGEKASKCFKLKQLEVPVSTCSSLLESTVTNGLTPSSKLGPVAEETGKIDEARILTEEEVARYGRVNKPDLLLEPRIMQEEIMDMYTKSMQQFSEALAKMQLPVDENGLIKLEESSSETNSKINTINSSVNAINSSSDNAINSSSDNAINSTIISSEITVKNNSSSSESGEKSSDTGKKSSQRVFYGSRAFF